MLITSFVVCAGVVGMPPDDRFVTDEQGRRAALPVAAADAGRGGGVALGLDPDWTALGPFGGDVEAVAASPADASIVLAGLAPAGSIGGAMYRSTDAGSTWSIVPSLDGVSVYDIAYAPDGTVYAATFDGVWKSVDDGATFTAQDLGIGLNDQAFAIAMSPADPETLFVGIADALGNQPVNVMRTTNGGASWQDVTPPLGSPIGCRTLAFDPADPSIVWAGFAGGFGGGATWVSTTGGDGWVNRSAGLPGTPVQEIVSDGTRVLVAGGLLFGGQDFGVYESSDMGASWTPVHDNDWPSLVINALAFDPNDDGVILAGSAGAGLFRSEDGGATWAFGVGGTGGLSLNDARFAPGDSDTIYLGASSIGVLASDDAGAGFAPSSVGIGALNTESVAVNPLDSQEMAIAFQGLNDGGVYTSLDAGQSWTLEPAPGTRYNTVAFHPDGTLYAVSDGPTGIAPEGVYRREGDGTWTSIGPDQGNLFESELFPLRFSQNDPQLFLAGGADFGVAGFEPTIWRSPDAGATWFKVYEGPVENEDVTDIEIVEDGTDTLMLATFTDFGQNPQTGGVLVSDDGGESWAPGGSGLDPESQPVRLAPVAGDPMAFRLADSDIGAGLGGVWLTEDAGLTWTKAGGVGAVRAIAGDPSDGQTVFIAQNDPAVSISTDGGAAFSPFVSDILDAAGFPRDLVVGGGRLLLASGTGVFATPLAGCPGDYNGDGALNILDFVDFQLGWQAMDAAADCDGNGAFNVLDFVCFQQLFQAGCP